MNTKPTISVGIAAYNEEDNIKKLITALLDQSCLIVDLKEILVVSDHSSDRTEEIVLSITDPRVVLIRHRERLGANEVQNTLAREARGDILIMLDGDILPKNNSFIDSIAAPLIEDSNVGLVSGSIIPAIAEGHFEKIIAESHYFKARLFGTSKRNNSVYTCFGPARAFSRALYTTIKFPDNCPYDSYSYFACLSKDLIFKFEPSAEVIFRSPTVFKDHVSQSRRFTSGINSLEKTFGVNAVRREYELSITSIIKESFRELVTHPYLFIAYVSMRLHIQFFKSKPQLFTGQWEIARSTKRI